MIACSGSYLLHWPSNIVFICQSVCVLGIQVKPGKPVTHSCEKSRGRLRISQASLGIGEATNKSVVQCNVGNRSPMVLCVLLPNKTESCHLELEFAEADDVVFSVIGPRSVYLTGYYVHQNPPSVPHSDTESYGVDIENSHTEGSSYGSDDYNYEDSFINDDDELQVSPPSPFSDSKAMDEDTPRSDKPSKGRGRKLKKKSQVIESDNDANSDEDDEDGFLLSVFKNKKAGKKTLSEAEEKVAQVTVEMGDEAKDNGIHGNESKEKVDPQDINGKPERDSKLPLDDEVTQVNSEMNELPENLENLAEIAVNSEKILIDDKAHENKAEATIINQNLPINDGKDQMQSPDLVKPKKKRKERSTEEKTCDIEIDKDYSVLRVDKKQVETPTNVEIAAGCLVEMGSNKGQKTKKRKKELHLEGSCSDKIVAKCDEIPKEDKLEQGQLHADSMVKELPANGEYKEPQIDNNIVMKSELLVNDSQPEKKTKKKAKKKTQGDGDVNMGVLNVTENQETTTFMKYEDQTTNAIPNQKRTLSNGLIIEVLANGPPDGKVAASGKKIKIYYTAMLKESGRTFDSNVGKRAYKFRLGDETLIDGWNVGIDGMHIGEKRRLVVPPSMGFGNVGVGENVPPNSWLVYDIELVSVHK
ncbi:hypothetical protein ACJIZ3_016178 [Penstemon smallii]|uniref:peptidylprolyl isomerase n=1 Tax=Penstemon smallii TaxID=265156 RepID=A0ABD3RPM7_9LAMI